MADIGTAFPPEINLVWRRFCRNAEMIDAGGNVDSNTGEGVDT